jgi:hypothetical protein
MVRTQLDPKLAASITTAGNVIRREFRILLRDPVTARTAAAMFKRCVCPPPPARKETDSVGIESDSVIAGSRPLAPTAGTALGEDLSSGD